jgi:uncharacterized SAM-binding protein YcdF (DUF218 family)
VLVAAVLACAWIAGLPAMYCYLDVTTAPQRADVIVVLSGAADRRIGAAVKLYRSGAATRMIISCHPVECTYIRDRKTVPPDLPPDRVQWVRQSESTWDEVGKILTLMRSINARSAVIITDVTHSRRARAVFQLRAAVMSSVSLTFAAAEVPNLSVDGWWQHTYPRTLVIAEYAKLIYYWLQYGIELN